MTDLKQITEDIYKPENPKTHRDFVRNYEKHEMDLDTVEYKTDQDIYNVYSKLIGDYALALTAVESYKKALPYIDKALDLYSNNPLFSASALQDTEMYRRLIFDRGRCNFYLENYEVARADFERLIELDPHNVHYPRWIRAINNKNLHKTKNILWISVSVSLLIETFLDRGSLKYAILGLGVFCLVSVILIEGYFFYQKKKYGA